MSKRLSVLLVASVLAANGLMAEPGWTKERDRASKEEGIGLGSGALIGAAAGGPIGFVLGAAFGGWLGDRFRHEKTARLAAEDAHQRAEANVMTLNGRMVTSEREIARLASALQSERTAHRNDLEQALGIEVFFRTEQSTLDETTGQRLAELASLVAPLGDTTIHIEGYADKRGKDDYNAALSTARATAVRDAFVTGGVPAERIVVTAQGETLATAEENDADGMALERRVAIRLVDSKTHRVALQQGN